MNLTSPAGISRIYGDTAVLQKLERLGRQPRLFANLVKAGFPERQLSDACQWFIQSAKSGVENYSANLMRRGVLEDESFASLLCRYFECTDWKLEYSPWFFSPQDHEKQLKEMLRPMELETEKLERGAGEKDWFGYFEKLPHDLGIERAKLGLWRDMANTDYEWKAKASYLHIRAGNIFDYLHSNINVLRFSPDIFNYNWEREYRQRIHLAFKRFESALGYSVQLWQETRRGEQRKARFRYNDFQAERYAAFQGDVSAALRQLELNPANATLAALQRNFRRLSKSTHPDHGGSPEVFQRLTTNRELLEQWLRLRGR